MTPGKYKEIRIRNEAAIRRLQRETDAAEQSASEFPPPPREELRPATIDDVRAQRVLWLDFEGELEWRIPSDEPHPSEAFCIDIDGESIEWRGSFVEIGNSECDG